MALETAETYLLLRQTARRNTGMQCNCDHQLAVPARPEVPIQSFYFCHWSRPGIHVH